MSKEPKPIIVRIDGGDNQLRTLLGDFFEAALVENGFHDVRLYYPNGLKADNVGQDAESVYDMIDRVRPELLETKIAILALPDERELIMEQDERATCDFKRDFKHHEMGISRLEQMAREEGEFTGAAIAVEIPVETDVNGDGTAP